MMQRRSAVSNKPNADNRKRVSVSHESVVATETVFEMCNCSLFPGILLNFEMNRESERVEIGKINTIQSRSGTGFIRAINSALEISTNNK